MLPENSAPTEESASSASINLDDDGGNGYDGSVNAAAVDDDDDDAYTDGCSSSSSGGGSNTMSGSSGDEYGDLSKGLAGGFLSDFWVFRKRPLSRGWGSSYDFAVDITLGGPLEKMRAFTNIGACVMIHSKVYVHWMDVVLNFFFSAQR